MYAVIVTGGKQYKAAVGDKLTVERLSGNAGDKVNLPVIFKSTENGIVTEKCEAECEILSHGKAKKITVFKYKPKKNIRKKQGHRQQFTRIKVLSV